MIITETFALSLHRVWGLHYSSEDGLTVLQVGNLILELAWLW